ncbi:MAG: multicopper oxidase domain-containing protein [Edaphobacter sp.]
MQFVLDVLEQIVEGIAKGHNAYRVGYVGSKQAIWIQRRHPPPHVHTPHWHGNTVLSDGHRTDVISIGPAQMETVDMIPDDPGIWMYHCHFDGHMQAGMTALYQVLP